MLLSLLPPGPHPALAPPFAQSPVGGGKAMSGWRSQGRLLLLNSLTCGLEICVAAGITYVPPLLLEAGVEERYMTMVLGIGPVLGLLFIPLIGSASDQCNSSYGRRRPFIWLLSLGVLLALFIIPNADLLAARLPWAERTLQVGFLILGVGLLDFCGQVCFTPLEALLSDLYRDEEDCGRAFAMFSFMVSVGGCVGYLLPAVDWSHSPLAAYLGGQAECLFSLLILIFVTSVIVTMKVSEEPSRSGPARSGPRPEPSGGAREAGRCGLPRSCFSQLRCKLRLLGAGPLLCLLRTCRTTIPTIFWSYCRVPRVIRQLCAAQLCGWMAVMSFMLFYTDFVGEGLYGGVPSAAPGSVARQRYDEGIRMGSLGLFLQCATSTMFSLAMSRLLRRFGPRRVYLGSMVSFTLSALGICLSGSVVVVTAMTALTGFAYATLQTVPYTLTCHYHKEKEVYLSPGKPRTSHSSNGVAAGRDAVYLTPAEEEGGVQNHKPPLHRQDGSEYFPLQQGEAGGERRGVGLDFAILDSTFLLSQVIPTLFMGVVVQLAGSVTAYIASSALFGAVAIYLSTRIVFDQKDLQS
ncbi:solute carrier family 45 member 3 [Xiphophorus couchianus]|uniref:solute carrier family 45 member 3 n=1 Tax=Xiphophorus couchianus TaxID=32473 RepID=UPI001016BDB8|nr:solute carrier family 45 member 3 [Xiphophorus couchianus]